MQLNISKGTVVEILETLTLTTYHQLKKAKPLNRLMESAGDSVLGQEYRAHEKTQNKLLKALNRIQSLEQEVQELKKEKQKRDKLLKEVQSFIKFGA